MTLSTIHNSTFQFLKKLEKNNNRTWFQEHKPTFVQEKEKVKSFMHQVQLGIEQDDIIEKMHLYRIYRDVRFSKDKTPYKTHFGGSFTRASSSRRGGYYFHIAPGNSFVGGGFFAPSKEDLYRVRKEIEIDPQSLRAILEDPLFINTFGSLQGNELKTAPRGFDKQHPAIDLLRKKQYYVLHQFTDKEMMSEGIIPKVVEVIKTLRPYFNYMSDVLTTDLNGESML